MEENKMGVMPVGKLLISMSLPMMLSMLVQALYNVVDSIFVARIDEAALTAVSLAFPVQNLFMSFGIGTGVGINALCARYLGAKNPEKVNSIATTGVRLAFITMLIFMAICAVFVKPFYGTLTDDPVIYNYGVTYTSIVGIVCVGVMFQVMFEKLLQATGKTVLSMISQLSGAITNIILDPILIFGLFGLPKMGVAGAALATVIGQICGATVSAIFCWKKNPEIHISLSKYKMNLPDVKEIYKIAIPSIMLTSVGSIMVFGLNKILLAFSATAAAVFGAYFKLQSFIFMPIFGLNSGLMPIVAYNYGAKKPERIRNVMIKAIIFAVSIMGVGCLVFQLFPVQLLSFFDASENMTKIGVVAFKIISIHFMFAGYCIISGALFQALGKAVYSMINSILRQLVFLLPAAYILSKIGGLDAVWYSFLIAELSSATVTTIYTLRIQKRILGPMYRELSIRPGKA